MFKQLLSRPRPDDTTPDLGWLDDFELIAGRVGPLKVRAKSARLTVQALQDLSRRLGTLAPRALPGLVFDLATVTDFIGPWGAHFAALVAMAEDLSTEVRITKLQARPRALVWLFRRSECVRRLFQASEENRRQAGGGSSP